MTDAIKLSKKDQYATQKRDKAAAIKEKRKAIVAKMSGGSEPTTDPFDYKVSLINALNWYNVNADYKEYRTWLNQYLIDTERKKFIPVINKASDYVIRSVGMLCRLKSRDQYLEDKESNFIETTIARLHTEGSEIKPVIDATDAPVKPKSIIDKTRDESIRLSEGFEEAIDKFVIDKKSDFNPLEYLKTNEVSAVVSKKIGEFYKTLLDELLEAQEGSDNQLVEGYSNFTKVQLKRFIAFIESLISACNQRVVSAKVRKPRAKKTVPPEKIIAKLKYQKEFEDLNLKSVKPTSLVESNEIWLYNTKTKRLFVYKAAPDNKLSVKGTAITGYDIKESVSVCVRKPDEFFKNTQLAKRALSTALKTIKTKPMPVNGRTCDTMIILGAF